ncbi:MAG: RepB family plasmid replication initiator protein, partial [Candidatus Electrothrix sp. AX2]|nr:RepB family plasmid replication initiator protein [Candidatus Electrothrix gigas]
MKKCPVVVQSNKLIESRYSLTVGEQRLILAMVARIDPDDKDFFTYEITLRELSILMNVDLPYIYHEIDRITERIMERVLHVQQPDGNLLKVHWLSTALHTKDSVVLSFAPELKPYLLRLKREFTKYNLVAITQFQSIYSIRIYQLLKQYKGIGYREFKLDELKDILGLKKTQYTVFKDFYRRVLNQAKKEFEKKDKSGKFKCDLTFELEKIREGRKIARLKFIIVEQEYQEVPAFLSDVSQKNQTDSQGESVGTPPEGVKDRLIYYGISP